MKHCPKCDSPAPHLHPAVQFEGEVQPCSHDYHKQVTPENTPARITETQELLRKMTNPKTTERCPTCGSKDRAVRKIMFHPTEDARCFNDDWHTTPQAGSVGLVGPVACRDLVCNGECGLQSVSAYGESAADLPAPSDSTARAFARNHGLNPDLVAAMNRKRVPQAGSGEPCPCKVSEGYVYRYHKPDCPNAPQSSTPAPQAQEAVDVESHFRQWFHANYFTHDPIALRTISAAFSAGWQANEAYARARVEQETDHLMSMILGAKHLFTCGNRTVDEYLGRKEQWLVEAERLLAGR